MKNDHEKTECDSGAENTRTNTQRRTQYTKLSQGIMRVQIYASEKCIMLGVNCAEGCTCPEVLS